LAFVNPFTCTKLVAVKFSRSHRSGRRAVRDYIDRHTPQNKKRRPGLGGVLIGSAEVVENDLTPGFQKFQFL
jgi:hypothetical protein